MQHDKHISVCTRSIAVVCSMTNQVPVCSRSITSMQHNKAITCMHKFDSCGVQHDITYARMYKFHSSGMQHDESISMVGIMTFSWLVYV